MSEQDIVANLRWNDYVSVATITLVFYDYLLLIDKEVEFVWKRQWSPMSCLYLIVRYLGLFLAIVCSCWGGLLYMAEAVSYDLIVLIEWGFSVYFCFAEAILIWRLYALYNGSRRILYVLLGLFLPIVALSIATDVYLYSRPSAFSVKEIITSDVKYCTLSFNIGPMPAIYTSIPIICYDIFLVVLAAGILVKHLKERRDFKMRPNTYVILIVRYHIIYFVLNLTNQVLLTMLWAGVPIQAMSLSELFNDTAPFIFAPRLIINCVCWTSLPTPDVEVQETDSQMTV